MMKNMMRKITIQRRGQASSMMDRYLNIQVSMERSILKTILRDHKTMITNMENGFSRKILGNAYRRMQYFSRKQEFFLSRQASNSAKIVQNHTMTFSNVANLLSI